MSRDAYESACLWKMYKNMASGPRLYRCLSWSQPLGETLPSLTCSPLGLESLSSTFQEQGQSRSAKRHCRSILYSVSSVAFLADLWVLLAWDHKLPSSSLARQETLRRNAVLPWHAQHLLLTGRMLGQAGRRSDPGCDGSGFPVINISTASLSLPRQRC